MASGPWTSLEIIVFVVVETVGSLMCSRKNVREKRELVDE
jgi:hypothetical protein